MPSNAGTQVRQDSERQSVPGVSKAGQSAGKTPCTVSGCCRPLATILEEGENGGFTADKATTVAKIALRFIGNVSIQMSRERRKRAIAEISSLISRRDI